MGPVRTFVWEIVIDDRKMFSGGIINDLEHTNTWGRTYKSGISVVGMDNCSADRILRATRLPKSSREKLSPASQTVDEPPNPSLWRTLY